MMAIRQSKWLKITLIGAGNLLVILFVALVVVTRSLAYKLVKHPVEARRRMTQTPADYGLPYEDVTVTTIDGLKLVGWYLPSRNGTAIIVQHGFKGDRTDMLATARVLYNHQYGVLISALRGHDYSQGELIRMGKDGMRDLEAWYYNLTTRSDIDPARIGILGESMGGYLATRYAAQNSNIKALVLHSVPTRVDDPLKVGIKRYTNLPPFPLAPMILFWAERKGGVEVEETDTTVWIRAISPRPVLILQGGADDHISTNSGEILYQAAGEPKELWYEPEATHHGFDLEPFLPEFEKRLVAFFDRYLLGTST